MDDEHLLDELLHAAEKLEVEVRTEPFEIPSTAGGGLCLIRGELLILNGPQREMPVLRSAKM